VVLLRKRLQPEPAEEQLVNWYAQLRPIEDIEHFGTDFHFFPIAEPEKLV
jgi:hypothetical protein